MMFPFSSTSVNSVDLFSAVLIALGAVFLFGAMFVHFVVSIGNDAKREPDKPVAGKTEDIQKDFLENILASITTPFLVLDSDDCTIKMANPAARQLGELTEETKCYMLTHNRQTPCPPGDHPCPLAEVKKTGRPVTVEHLHYTADGSQHRHQINGYPVFNQEGRVEQVIEYITDITDRKQAEKQIRLLSSVVEQSTDGMAIADPEGRLLFVNQAWARMHGFKDAGELLGQHLSIFHNEEQLKNDVEPFNRKVFEKGYNKGEVGHVRKDGSVFPTQMTTDVLKDEEGNSIAIAGVATDITERKRVEEALVRAKEAAECATRAKSEFLARMSHEIRTPMNGIMGMNGLLLDTELTREQREYAEAVDGSAKSLLSVINNILDFSKVEAGKLDFEVLDFDLRATLEDVCDVLAVRPQEKGLEYICMMDPEVPFLLRGDPGRLRQVLTNLVDNAVKFTSRGEVSVKVTLEGETGDRATLRFEVSDSGIGIPERKMKLLFDAFTQADTSTSREYGGTGLGLAISRQLVDLMGGRIGVESEEGRGSTFWFTADFLKQPAGKGSPAGHACEDADSIRGQRVLVVDENANSRLLLKKYLLSWDCRHDEAPDAETALAKLRAAAETGDGFHVAVVDARVAGTDGGGLGRAVLEDVSLGDVVLIMMIPIGRRVDVSCLGETGFSAFLTKPVRQSQLFNCLVAALDGGAGRGSDGSKAAVARPVIARERNRKIRILVAEDNATNQVLALKALERYGFRADAVSSGGEAVEMLEKVPYDLVLMDVEMPGMDGFEATRRIRDADSPVRDHSIPVVALTAHAMKGDREKCLEAGMDDYISKPIDPQELITVIERWVNGTSSSKQKTAARDVFDGSALLDRLGGDGELARLVVGTFLKDAPDQIRGLGASCECGDLDGIRRQAHSLKSACGNVGAVLLQDVLHRLERACEDGNLDEALSLVTRVEKEFEEVKGFLADVGKEQVR